MFKSIETAQRISSYFDEKGGKVVLGIDGSIDEVWQIVANKKSKNEYVFYDKMKSFADVVHSTGTGGLLGEIILKRRSYGGFTCNTGKSVGCLGFDLTLIGAFGKDRIEPVFREFQEKHEVITVCNPCQSEVFEFTDGKIMLAHIAETSNITWEQLVDALTWDVLHKIYRDADVVGLGYWSLLNNFDDLVAQLCEHFVGKDKKARMFFDFSDFRKHDRSMLLHTFDILSGLNDKVAMTLSVNEHEATTLFSHFGRDFEWKAPTNIEKDIEFIRESIGLDEFIIHTPHYAVASTAYEGTAKVSQRYCTSPVITTGAGDNFNGGYIAASVRHGELNLSERLLVGNAATGFYIRNGYSPNKIELSSEVSEILKETT